MKCKKCGTEIVDGGKFCPKCGKNNDFFYYFNRIIIGIVIVLVLVIIISFSLFDRMSGGNFEKKELDTYDVNQEINNSQNMMIQLIGINNKKEEVTVDINKNYIENLLLNDLKTIYNEYLSSDILINAETPFQIKLIYNNDTKEIETVHYGVFYSVNGSNCAQTTIRLRDSMFPYGFVNDKLGADTFVDNEMLKNIYSLVHTMENCEYDNPNCYTININIPNINHNSEIKEYLLEQILGDEKNTETGNLHLKNLDFTIELDANGKVKIKETWDIKIKNTNTLFKTFDYNGIEDVKVTEIVNNEKKELKKASNYSYHVEKDCYHSLKNPEGMYEIAWGVGLDESTAEKVYIVEYSLNDKVIFEKDYSNLKWRLFGKDFGIPISKVTGTIILAEPVEKKNDIKLSINGINDSVINIDSLDKITFSAENINNYAEIDLKISNHKELTYEDKKIKAKEALDLLDIEVSGGESDISETFTSPIRCNISACYTTIDENNINYKLEKLVITNQQTNENLEITDQYPNSDSYAFQNINLIEGTNTIIFTFYDNYGNTRQETKIINKLNW